MVIVPRTDGNGNWKELKVVVLDVAAAGDNLLGEKHHHHVTAVTNLGGRYHAPLTGQWTLTSKSLRPIERVTQERYLFLQRNYPATDIGFVRPTCYGTDAEIATCTGKKYPNVLVRAVLTFKGGWRVRPVEITHDREPRATRDDNTTWGFARVPVGPVLLGGQLKDSLRLPRVTPDEIQLAGGLILDPLDDAEAVIEPPKSQSPIGNLAELRPGVCTLFAAYTGGCAVLRFLNTMHAISYELGDQVQVDFTQDLMYDLFNVDFDAQNIPRYLTFLRKDASLEVMDLLYPGGGGTPFPRPCPPPAFAPEVTQ
jgi:hypothetical protein